MEASNFQALYFKAQLNQPTFFSHVMLDKRQRASLPGDHLYMCPHRYCRSVLNAKLGQGAHQFPVFLGVNLTHSPLLPLRQASRLLSLASCHVTREEPGETSSGESILLNEQNLERELQIAIEEENYVRAAKIRDSLKLLQEDTKASVLAANAKFYNSFRNGNLAEMQSLWSKGEHVCVVHPGVSGISGYDLVMGSWEFVWADYEFPLEIELKDVQVHVRGDIGYVTCIEMVKTKGSSWGRHFATNVFEKIDGQWLICIHHTSYIEL